MMTKPDSLTGKTYSDFIQSKKANQTAIVCLSVALAVVSIMAFTKDTEVIAVPYNFQQEVRVEGKQANEAYMTSHAIGFASMLGNISERNVEFVMKTMSKNMSPYLEQQLAPAMKNEAQLLTLRKASQTFIIEDMMYEPRNNIVWVWGMKTVKVPAGTEHKERFTYEFRIEPHAGNPRITHFDAYPGIPKTKNNAEYVVDTLPYLTDALDKAKANNDPSKAEYRITPAQSGENTKQANEGEDK